MKTDELLARIGLAWTRTFYFVMEGAFGDVALWDVGIIAATVVVGLVVFALPHRRGYPTQTLPPIKPAPE